MSHMYHKLMRRFADDILFFGKMIRPSIFEVESPPFHRKIIAYLRREEYQYLNIIAPRGFAKTTVVGFLYVLWHIFVEDFCNERPRQPKFVVIVSKSRSHSINILTSLKNTLNSSAVLKKIFGDFSERTALQWREDKIILKDGTIIDCRGMRQQVRGMNINNRRPTLIVLDDAEDEENTKTMEAINGNRKWFLNALMPMIKRTEPRGRIINIGTPQHQSCLVYTLMEMEQQWKTLKFSAIYKDKEDNEHSLWPEMMPLEELKRLRDSLASVGRVSAFYREYLCEIVGDEDSLVVPEYLRFWRGRLERPDMSGRAELVITHQGLHSEPERLPEPLRVPVFLFMGVDPASTLSANSDYSVIFVIAVDAHRNKYCLHYVRKRMKPLKLAKTIIEEYEEYRPEKTRIESTGYQEMIRDYLRNEYSEYIPGIEIPEKPRDSKTRRLEGLQTDFARGKVFLNAEGMDEFVEELLLYPRAKNDDTLDGYYYAQKKSYGPTEDLTSTERERIEKELGHFTDYEGGIDPAQDWLLS